MSNSNTPELTGDKALIDRLNEIAHRDSAVAVTVRADDLRAVLDKLRQGGELVAWQYFSIVDQDWCACDPERVEALKKSGMRVRPLYAAPQASAACPTDVCRAGQQDGVLCANDECDRANGVRPAPQPAQTCATCGGTGMVDDGWITGSGGVEYECGPVKCVKDCPDCDTGPRKLREARAAVLADRQQRSKEQ